jgi:tRNA(fMet)-specific endonuclease VapC
MSLWVFETDHISLWQTDHPAIRKKLAQIEPKDFAVTVISFEEQMRGRLNTISQAKSDAALVAGYRYLKLTDQFFRTLNVLEYTTEAQIRFR